uniref:Uncharacterized protein n=1 Tax=Romanomermis culicivorax TaxID=13658 RepID=A0A915IW63_ROMCU
KDATRAFVTGDFSEKGLVDYIDGLTSQDLLGIQEWIQFYEKEYKAVGTLSGTYYDDQGRPTPKLEDAKRLFESAKNWQQSQKADYERYPPCNSEWTQGKGGRVWCSSRFGAGAVFAQDRSGAAVLLRGRLGHRS